MPFWDEFQRGYDISSGNKDRQLDKLLKITQLKEAGYDVSGKPGLFGGGFALKERPDFVSAKELEREELQGKLQDAAESRALASKYASGELKPPPGQLYDPIQRKLERDYSYQGPLDQNTLMILAGQGIDVTPFVNLNKTTFGGADPNPNDQQYDLKSLQEEKARRLAVKGVKNA